MSTVRTLTEETQRLYAKTLHRDDISPTLHRREARLYVIQSINQILKIQYLEAFKEGHVEVPRSSIATYENIPVITDPNASGYAILTLPAFPIRLPMDLGVYEIHQSGQPLNAYIPIVGMDHQLFAENPAAVLEGHVGYYVDGKIVRFTENITAGLAPVTQVTVKLLIQNLDKITEDELLPLSADQHAEVVKLALLMLGVASVGTQELNKREEREKQLTDE